MYHDNKPCKSIMHMIYIGDEVVLGLVMTILELKT